MPKKTEPKIKESSYTASDITVLEGLDPVRKRPGMYIGTTGPDGLHHLITEVFDNSRDEAMGGYANDIEIVLLPGKRVRVTDNGRGIPVDKHKQTGVSALQTIMTVLHAGGKFGGEGYKVSGGLHGVGVSVVNALSSYMRTDVYRDGGHYMQEYHQGKPKGSTKKLESSNLRGTTQTFEADPEIFPEIVYNWDKIVNHMRQQAYLVRGLRIAVIDAREAGDTVDFNETMYTRDLGLDVPSMTFYFEGGLISFIRHQNEFQKSLHKTIFFVEKEQEGVDVEVALQYVDDVTNHIFAFANNTYNSEGGTHITGFKTALTRTLNIYAKKTNILKESDGPFSGDDVLEGLSAVVSVKLREIQFEGQTKAKLGSVEARSAVEAVFGEAFTVFLEEHPEEARAIISKVVLALRARKAAKAAKDSILRKGALEGMTLPGKLADCQTKDASESELFIVEGESAGGTAKTGRDRRTQAILPLRGKILNVERARLDRMLGSEQIKNLVIALGTAISDTFDISKLRYHKVVIATDADVDGAHIRTLLLTLFYRYFKPLIEGGFIYIAQPPLYKVKKAKEVHYFYTEEEKDAFLKEEGVDVRDVEEESEGSNENGEGEEPEDVSEANEANETKKLTKQPKLSIQRYKGLGEMNADELWETTMDPARRILKQVDIEDAQEADRIFDILMGTDVPSRKTFIQSNAKLANIDI
ncbi:type IIA DNA topoisomerase subunit B [Candidatus Campbellbacteria bacterium]|nr:MAG: type IIA DNA topoisomerase subunit B [Candidatus Campbellbacteria bacterium]